MSTIALKNTTAGYDKCRKTLKERILDYYKENINIITIGLYTLSGRVPDIGMLRTMNML